MKSYVFFIMLLLCVGSVSAALTDGLTYVFPLNESSGTNVAEVISAFDLTDVNTPTHVVGMFSNARNYSRASSQHSSISSAPFNLGNNFSVQAWFRISATPDTLTNCGFHQPGTNAIVTIEEGTRFIMYGLNVCLRQDDSALVLGMMRNSDGLITNFLLYDFDLQNDTWYHAVATHNQAGSNMTLYLNGAVVNSTTITESNGTGSSGNLLSIGSGTSGNPNSAHFDGVVDEVLVWDRAITDQEVSDLYNGGSGNAYPFTEEVLSILDYNITSAYHNQTAATGSDVAYTRDGTPSIEVTLSSASNTSCGIYNQNYLNMISNDSTSQAATEDTISHTCTLSVTQQMIEGIQPVYIAVQDSGSVFADLELNISLDWNFTALFLDQDTGIALLDSLLIVSTAVEGDSNFGPGGTNSTGLTDVLGMAIAYAAFPNNYTARMEYTNASPQNITGLKEFEVK